MDVTKVLSYALEREREGHRFFSEHAAKASHASVVHVFRRLAAEELAHIKFVERLLAEQGAKKPSSVEPPAQDAGFFSERAASEMIEQTTVEAMVPDLPVLRMAFLIERDLSEFYRNAARHAEGEAKKALEMLSAWETEHERLFKTLHDKVFAEYSGMPWGG